MKRVLLNVLAGAALAASPALAQFEGEVDMRITSQGMTGTGKAFVSKAAARTEIDLQSAQMPIHMVSLVKFAAPDVVILINDTAKTYTEMNVKKSREAASKMTGSKEPFTVKVLGSERLLGYSTKHVLLSRPGEQTEMELWTTKDVAGLSFETVRGLMRRGSSQDDGSLLKALRDAGADGFFVKMITREKGKAAPLSTMELTKAEKKSLPASLFEVPAGYTKQEGVMGAAGVVSPEAADAMRKAMENMTPEQRKQLEDMIKKRQGQ